MIVRPSALKHGISETDGIEAATWPVLVMRSDDGTEELIHCMRARKKYLRLL